MKPQPTKCPKCGYDSPSPFERVKERTGVTFYTCRNCGERIESLPRKISNLYYRWKFFTGRGEWFISDLNGLVNAIGGLGVVWLILFGFELSSKAWWLIFVWLGQKALVCWLGHRDYYKWHIYQRETAYTTTFSPIEVQKIEQLDDIHAKICPEKHKGKSVLDWFAKK